MRDAEKLVGGNRHAKIANDRRGHLCPPPPVSGGRQLASCFVQAHSPQHVAQIFDGLPQPPLGIPLVHDVTGPAVVHGLGHAVAVAPSLSGARDPSGPVGAGGDGSGSGEGRGVLRRRVSLLLQLLALSPVELGLSLLFESQAGLGREGGSVRSAVAFSVP